MGYRDLHCHSVFCDGKSSPREMVESAIEKGLDTLGIVVHSFVDFDTGYCISPENEETFLNEMTSLKEEYKDKIKLLSGIEQDIISKPARSDYDYVIGSVHYLVINGLGYSLDVSREHFMWLANVKFGGDYLALCEAYYEETAKLAALPRLDITGHFDIVTKFNEGDVLFDTDSERYRRAWQAAADRLIPLGVPFELNTGAVSRGYRTAPYPKREIIDYIKSHGGKLVLSSDSHTAKGIASYFDDYAALVK